MTFPYGFDFLQKKIRRPPQLSFDPIIFLYSSTPPETTTPSRLARSSKRVNFRKVVKKKQAFRGDFVFELLFKRRFWTI